MPAATANRSKKTATAQKAAPTRNGADSERASGRSPSIWRGAISFGMVSIPVRLFTAISSKDISFNLLHEKCNSRMKQIRWCPRCEREVPWEEVVKGFEYARDRYVRLTDEDFASVPVPSKHVIDLESFVEQEEIDPIYYEKSYYLEPEAAGQKAYSLLVRALEAKRKLAVAKIALREKERLCVLRPFDGGLILETLYYPDEIRARAGVELKEVPKRELDMALMLIESYSEPFDPKRYRDEYREALESVIEAKVAGKELVTPPEAPHLDEDIDLFEGLRRTLEARQRETAPVRDRAARKAA